MSEKELFLKKYPEETDKEETKKILFDFIDYQTEILSKELKAIEKEYEKA